MDWWVGFIALAVVLWASGIYTLAKRAADSLEQIAAMMSQDRMDREGPLPDYPDE